MFVFTVEDRTLKVGFQRLDGAVSDVICEMQGAGRPKALSQLDALVFRNGWQSIVFTPSLETSLKSLNEITFGRKDFVLKGTLRQQVEIRRDRVSKQRSQKGPSEALSCICSILGSNTLGL